MATLRTSKVKHELSEVDNIVLSPDGSTSIADLVADGLLPDVAQAQEGDVLAVVSGEPAWQAPDVPVSAASVGDLADVDTSGAADGDALVFDGTAGEWVAGGLGNLSVIDGGTPSTEF